MIKILCLVNEESIEVGKSYKFGKVSSIFEYFEGERKEFIVRFEDGNSLYVQEHFVKYAYCVKKD
jgi:hypothetical protein